MYFFITRFCAIVHHSFFCFVCWCWKHENPTINTKCKHTSPSFFAHEIMHKNTSTEPILSFGCFVYSSMQFSVVLFSPILLCLPLLPLPHHLHFLPTLHVQFQSLISNQLIKLSIIIVQSINGWINQIILLYGMMIRWEEKQRNISFILYIVMYHFNVRRWFEWWRSWMLHQYTPDHVWNECIWGQIVINFFEMRS